MSPIPFDTFTEALRQAERAGRQPARGADRLELTMTWSSIAIVVLAAAAALLV